MTTPFYETIFRQLAVIAALITVFASCGSEGDSKTSPRSSKSQLQQRIESEVRSRGIPPRFALAVAYMESGLSPQPSTALYVTSATEKTESAVGFPQTETAFGVSTIQLGLQGDPQKNDLIVQFKAYADWLKTSFEDNEIDLPFAPSTVAEKVAWIYEMSQFHRAGTRSKATVRTVFFHELARVLNEGFYWQDPVTGQSIVLAPESNEITKESAPDNFKDYFELRDRRSEINIAQRLGLSEVLGVEGNQPNHLEIIHCPLSLSSCLAIQSKSSSENVKMEAHYVIPNDTLTFDRPIQIMDHSNSARLTDENGNIQVRSDAIVIMLVGPSGRLEEGARKYANPKWLSRGQLQELVLVASQVCDWLAEKKLADYEKCMTIPASSGAGRNAGEVKVRTPSGAAFRWGDLPDYDSLIFYNYFNARGDKLGGSAAFEQDYIKVRKGVDFTMQLNFFQGVRTVVYETLVLCGDNSMRWNKFGDHTMRGETSHRLTYKFWDKGPNGNGVHYIRAKVYDAGSLVGWDMAEVYLTDFNISKNPNDDLNYDINPEGCRR